MVGNIQTLTLSGIHEYRRSQFISDNVDQILYCWASQSLTALSKLMLQVHRRVVKLFLLVYSRCFFMLTITHYTSKLFSKTMLVSYT